MSAPAQENRVETAEVWSDDDWLVACPVEPLRSFLQLQDHHLPIPADLSYTVRNQVLGWYGRTLCFEQHWSERRFFVRPTADRRPSMTVTTRLASVVAWLGGEKSTLTMLAEGEPFELDGEWTEMLTAHGLIQLTLRGRVLSQHRLPTYRAWAAQVEQVPKDLPIKAAVEGWPCPS